MTSNVTMYLITVLVSMNLGLTAIIFKGVQTRADKIDIVVERLVSHVYNNTNAITVLNTRLAIDKESLQEVNQLRYIIEQLKDRISRMEKKD